MMRAAVADALDPLRAGPRSSVSRRDGIGDVKVLQARVCLLTRYPLTSLTPLDAGVDRRLRPPFQTLLAPFLSYDASTPSLAMVWFIRRPWQREMPEGLRSRVRLPFRVPGGFIGNFAESSQVWELVELKDASVLNAGRVDCCKSCKPPQILVRMTGGGRVGMSVHTSQ